MTTTDLARRSGPEPWLLRDALGRAFRLLIVDDDEVSVMAIDRALARLGVMNPRAYARDGVLALEALQAAIDERGALAPPHLVLLDLRMPRMGGLELLGVIRADAALAELAVVVLTTSTAPHDVDAAQRLGALECLAKDRRGSPPLSEALAAVLARVGAAG